MRLVTDSPIKEGENFALYLIALLIGLILGFLAWFIISHLIASIILLAEKRYPNLAGSKAMQVGELMVCGIVFLGCLAFAIWIASLLWSQMK
jgi:hypothetical protein